MTSTMPTLSTEQVRIHRIRVGNEWAYIVADDATGLFTAHGSYGTYAYVWAPQHRSQPLIDFLADLDFSYFMGKTRGTAARQFDCDATIKAVKEQIIEQRRGRSIDKNFAREAFDDLNEMGDHFGAGEFLDELVASRTLMKVVGDDYYDVCRETPTPETREFWRLIWPAFLTQAKESRIAA